jgi:hypothetical protein
LNPYLQKANDDYTQAGVDFQGLLSWHLMHGVVVCNSTGFGIGFHADSESAFKAVEYAHSDTLFAVYFAGDFLSACHALAGLYEYIAWQRSFKGSDRIRCRRLSDIIKTKS